MVEKSDRDKGIHILEAFRYYILAPGRAMTVDMLTSYFEQNGLNLDDMESGLITRGCRAGRRMEGVSPHGLGARIVNCIVVGAGPAR